MLLVATPFVLLRNFLVETIGRVSGSTLELAGAEIPIVPSAAILLLVVLLIRFRAYLSGLRILAMVIAVLMIALAQRITDYYFDHRFYDLQQNWHYIAYAIFAFMMYRDLAPRRTSRARIMLLTYVTALLFSSFDEVFQLRVSNRVFDTSDIAKDVWGTLTGIVLLYFGTIDADTLRSHWKRIRHQHPRDCLRQPSSLLILLLVLTVMMLFFSSLLSNSRYWWLVLVLTVGGFLIFFVLFHVSRYRWAQVSLLVMFGGILALQTYSLIKHRSDSITRTRYGLTLYKGVPLVFFDVLIFPDGTFRPVDKKAYFNSRDQAFFLKRKPDILLIGSGPAGNGGRGFFLETPSQFVYNRYTQRGTQVIILNNTEACRLFNRLKREGKNVLFVLHNTD